MLVPLYGFVEGDTIGLLVLAHDDMTLSRVVEKLADSASVRVSPDGPWELVVKGRVMPLDETVHEAGLSMLDRIDLRRPA